MQTGYSGKKIPRNYEAPFLPFLVLLPLSIASFWFWSSYFTTSPATGLSWYGQDGHCELSDALGNHCFGDIAALDYQNPQSPEAMYPRTSRIFTYPLIYVYDQVGSYLAILLLAGATLALLICSVRCLLAETSSKVPLVVLLVFLTSNVGFLAMIDRGNVTGLAVGFLFLALVLGRRDADSSPLQKGLIVTLVVAALSMKPQYLVFVVLLPFSLQFAVIIGTTILYLIAYSPVTGGSFASLLTWLQEARMWAGSYPDLQNFPPNLSYQKTVLFVPALIAIAFLGFTGVRTVRAEIRTRGLAANPAHHRSVILLSLVLYLTLNSIVYVYNLMLMAMIAVLWNAEISMHSNHRSHSAKLSDLATVFLTVPLVPIFIGDLRLETFTLNQTNWNVAITLSALLASVMLHGLSELPTRAGRKSA